MNEEKWILATVKRKLVEWIKKEEIHYEYDNETIVKVLAIIATAEADAILGTPEIIEDTVNKLLDAGCDEEGCPIFPESEVE